MAMGGRPLLLDVIHHLPIGGMQNGQVALINTIPCERVRHAVLCADDFSDFRYRIQSPDVDVVDSHRC